ncbi:hypothetical protein RP20_CCG026964 [Aedes albopictus]|nr:hypothetical protein RP20_CCG026964 [Aedes albopictus]
MEAPVSKLSIRNFPESFSEADVRDFLSRFGIASRVEFLKRRRKLSAVVSCSEPALSRCILSRLHQLKVLDNRLIVECYDDLQEVEIVDCDDGNPSRSKLKDSTQEISKFVKALHAVHPVDFDQPPPPYLRYRYPRPTREIIDSICVALESVPKFYTQVLHLMNRMNLPPPFTPRDVQGRSTVVDKKDASQQTDPVRIKECLLVDDESELESDEEKTSALGPIKRKPALIKSRYTPYQPPQIVNAPQTDSVPVKPKLIKASQNIILRIPDEIKPPIKAPTPPPRSPTPPPTNTHITEIDPLANRIPSDQLSDLPVFKNYTPGTPSNKLYLKNLAKSVTEEDLKQIFHRFAITADPTKEIDIKLMQSGRMKGQAFVTFSYVYEEDLDRLPERPIARALRLTNGLLLKDKPMVVVYGKSSNNKAGGDDGGEKASS